VGVVRTTLELIEPDLRARQIRLAAELPEAAPVSGDPTELSQVALNLVLNARDSLKQVEHTNKTITVRILRDTGWVVLEVTDNGAGIASEHQARLFEPFFTTRPVGEGLGLGLSICHELVTRHQGRIEVESQEGRGARFRVRLPAA
jgi:signal transduction histidine kinase